MSSCGATAFTSRSKALADTRSSWLDGAARIPLCPNPRLDSSAHQAPGLSHPRGCHIRLMHGRTEWREARNRIAQGCGSKLSGSCYFGLVFFSSEWPGTRRGRLRSGRAYLDRVATQRGIAVEAEGITRSPLHGCETFAFIALAISIARSRRNERSLQLRPCS
jgi:hypothetical protein